jgi:hypothetical protein
VGGHSERNARDLCENDHHQTKILLTKICIKMMLDKDKKETVDIYVTLFDCIQITKSYSSFLLIDYSASNHHKIVTLTKSSCCLLMRQAHLCASLRRVDAAEVLRDVGFVPVDGAFERGPAVAAAQGVRERLRRARGAAALVSRGDVCFPLD